MAATRVAGGECLRSIKVAEAFSLDSFPKIIWLIIMDLLGKGEKFRMDALAKWFKKLMEDSLKKKDKYWVKVKTEVSGSKQVAGHLVAKITLYSEPGLISPILEAIKPEWSQKGFTEFKVVDNQTAVLSTPAFRGI